MIGIHPQVRIELARGIDVNVQTHTSLGSVRNNVPSRQDAPAKCESDPDRRGLSEPKRNHEGQSGKLQSHRMRSDRGSEVK